MPRIKAVRPVLLSAPYADDKGNLEVKLHLPSGLRTTGLVEITLDNGAVGLGEGYIAVFAPHVFTATVELLAPIVIGQDIQDVRSLMRKLETATGYWSFEGAARHVLSAFEIALQDARAQTLGLPLWKALGETLERLNLLTPGSGTTPLHLYASGGDSISPEFMRQEIDAVAALGIDIFKIRARKHQTAKAIWCRREAKAAGISIAVDMTQNLAIPSQEVSEVLAFLDTIYETDNEPLAFLEEALGPRATLNLRVLRKNTDTPIAGGEIVTVPWEFDMRLGMGFYDIVQPDATVIGGIEAVLYVRSLAKQADGTRTYPHCWGSGVGMLANYHAALAGGCEMAEWPMPRYDLRPALFTAPLNVEGGRLTLPDIPGLGAQLTPQVEKEFKFREEAVYRCLVDSSAIPEGKWT